MPSKHKQIGALFCRKRSIEILKPVVLCTIGLWLVVLYVNYDGRQSIERRGGTETTTDLHLCTAFFDLNLPHIFPQLLHEIPTRFSCNTQVNKPQPITTPLPFPDQINERPCEWPLGSPIGALDLSEGPTRNLGPGETSAKTGRQNSRTIQPSWEPLGSQRRRRRDWNARRWDNHQLLGLLSGQTGCTFDRKTSQRRELPWRRTHRLIHRHHSRINRFRVSPTIRHLGYSSEECTSIVRQDIGQFLHFSRSLPREHPKLFEARQLQVGENSITRIVGVF